MNVKAMWLTGLLALVAGPIAAQPAPQPGATARVAAAPVSPQRFQIRIMEGVLENAVQHGAQLVSTQMRVVSPDISLFSGPARARGFRLDGYGVFFAVDVPVLHRSVSWSMRTLSQSNGELTRALQSIRRMVQTQHDARMKTELEQALRLVELQVGPPAMRSPGVSSAMTAQPASTVTPSADASQGVDNPAGPENEPALSAEAAAILNDPSEAYTDAVQRAIADAMLDYGSTLQLQPDEWLTVAARENTDSILTGDLSESVTITLRLKASDLEALKAGRLTRDEAARRVEVKAF